MLKFNEFVNEVKGDFGNEKVKLAILKVAKTSNYNKKDMISFFDFVDDWDGVAIVDGFTKDEDKYLYELAKRSKKIGLYNKLWWYIDNKNTNILFGLDLEYRQFVVPPSYELVEDFMNSLNNLW